MVRFYTAIGFYCSKVFPQNLTVFVKRNAHLIPRGGPKIHMADYVIYIIDYVTSGQGQ